MESSGKRRYDAAFQPCPSIVINYCTNEAAFLPILLRECCKISDEVIVSYGDKLYDGTIEDHSALQSLKSAFPGVTFSEYTVDVSLPVSQRKGVMKRPTAYWHNLARWNGLRHVSNDWILLLDADEIPEGDRFAEWFVKSSAHLDESCAYKIANYWYFKSARYRAVQIEDSVLLMHASHMTEDNIFGDNERDHLIAASGAKLVRQLSDARGTPMFHHFSWVRTRDGMMTKLTNWAHRDDMFSTVTPQNMADYIFGSDAINDIVHNYTYNVVDDKFGLDHALGISPQSAHDAWTCI